MSKLIGNLITQTVTRRGPDKLQVEVVTRELHPTKGYRLTNRINRVVGGRMQHGQPSVYSVFNRTKDLPERRRPISPISKDLMFQLKVRP